MHINSLLMQLLILSFCSTTTAICSRMLWRSNLCWNVVGTSMSHFPRHHSPALTPDALPHQGGGGGCRRYLTLIYCPRMFRTKFQKFQNQFPIYRGIPAHEDFYRTLSHQPSPPLSERCFGIYGKMKGSTGIYYRNSDVCLQVTFKLH